MTQHELALVSDQSLTDAARIIGLRIAALGDDWHELAPDDFSRMVAGYPKQDTIAKHLRQLEMAGYITRKAGGRGHSDLFRLETAQNLGPKEIANVTPVTPGVLSIRPKNTSDLKPLEEDDEDRVTPISPFEVAIEQHAEKLAGCRGSLRDYIVGSIPAGPRQRAYVQTVASYLDDIDPSVWALSTGGWLPKDQRVHVLAVALNELAAGDEKMMKRPVGDPANLKTKISILLQQRGENGRRRDGAGRANPGKGGKPAGGGAGKYASIEGADYRPGA